MDSDEFMRMDARLAMDFAVACFGGPERVARLLDEVEIHGVSPVEPPATLRRHGGSSGGES